MKHIEKIKEMLNGELEVFSKKNAITMSDLEKIQRLSESIKNLGKIALMEQGEYDDMEGSSAYARGRGRGRNAKRDSMGRYSREDGYSEEGGSYYGGSSRGSSYEDDMSSYERGGRGGQGGGRGNQGGRSSYRGGSSYGNDDMMSMLGEMMEDANPKEREALKKCMRALEEM